MRSIDIIKQKRRFVMFNKESKEKVLELNQFFGKYLMRYEEKIKKTFVYYDTPNFDLLKSNIVLYKTIIGNFCELNMATEKISSTQHINLRTQYHHFTKQIKAHDNILKHKEFLMDSFASMFMSGLAFDSDFLMRKLQVAYTIETTSLEYRSINATGLKITYSFDEDKYKNFYNNIIENANVLTIYQHSGANTDEEFENLISKLNRYCKELTQTQDTKIMIARKLTSQKEAQLHEQQRILEQKKKEQERLKKRK